ncbi:MAG: ABC transporter permease [Thermoflexales bacterium]|nr:ABC transporter permease [Thermoflexales bacterium]MDW8351178.1 ABC transporter permease [Anaerolineae bacterium]
MAVATAPSALPVAKKREIGQSYWDLVKYRFKKNKLGVLGLILLIVLYVSFVAIPEFLAPYQLENRSNFVEAPPTAIRFVDAEGRFQAPFIYGLDRKIDAVRRLRTWEINTDRKYPVRLFVQGDEYRLFGLIPMNIHLFGIEADQSEQRIFIMGSDSLGRDYFTRILYGGRLSLMIGLLGQFLTLVLGVTLGVISGYYGGAVDMFVQRFTEFLSAFPNIPLFMALSAAIPVFWPPATVYFMLTIILAFLGWGGLARQVRGLILSLREREYALAAKSFGASDRRIMFRHLMPGTMSHVIVIATLSIPGMILAETALSWLGLGLRPPLTSWGTLLQDAGTVRAIRFVPWLLWVVPPILLTILTYNMLGDGLRDALDPYSGR